MAKAVIPIELKYKKSSEGFSLKQQEAELKKHVATIEKVQDVANAKADAALKLHNQKLYLAEEARQAKALRSDKDYQERLVKSAERAHQRLLTGQRTWSEKMTSSLVSLKNMMIATAVTFASVYVLQGLKRMVVQSYELGDALSDLSKKLKIDTNLLQKYRFAAIETGYSLEDLGNVLSKMMLSKVNQKAFEGLGLGLATWEEKLNKIFQLGKDNPEGLAALGFDRTTIDMIATLAANSNILGKSIEQLKAEGMNFIPPNQIEILGNFNDQLELLKADLIPAIAKGVAAATPKIKEAVEAIFGMIERIDWVAFADGLLVIIRVIEWLGDATRGLVRGFTTLVTVFDVGGLFERLMEGGKLLKEFASIPLMFEEKEIDKATLVMKKFAESTNIVAKAYNKLLDLLLEERLINEIKRFIDASKEVGRVFTTKADTLFAFARANIVIIAEKFYDLEKLFNTKMIRIMDAAAAKLVPIIKIIIKLQAFGVTIANVFNWIIVAISKLVPALTRLGAGLSPIFRMLGKAAWILQVAFFIYDLIDAFSKGANVLEAFGYALAKIISDISDFIHLITGVDFFKKPSEWLNSWKNYWKTASDSIKSDSGVIVKAINDIDTAEAKRRQAVLADAIESKRTYIQNLTAQLEYTPTEPPKLGGVAKGSQELYFTAWDNQVKAAELSNKKLNWEIDRQCAALLKLKDQYYSLFGVINKQAEMYGPEQMIDLGISQPSKKVIDNLAELRQKLLEEMKAYKEGEDEKRNTIKLLNEMANSGLYFGNSLQFIINKLVELRGELPKITMSDFKPITYLVQRPPETEIDLGGLPEHWVSPTEQKFWAAVAEGAENGFGKAKSVIGNFYQNYQQIISETANLVQSVFDSEVTLMDNKLERTRELINLENLRWDKESENLRASGLEYTTYYKNQLKVHNDTLTKYEKRETEQKIKAWDADKKSREAGVIMTTAQAFMNAWTVQPVWFAPILAALVAATGVVQLATIMGTKNPYRKALGGWVGGQGFGDSQHTMLTPGEYVVNRNAAKENARALEYINSGRNLGSTSNNVNVYIEGDFIGTEEFVNSTMIPLINKGIKRGYSLKVA
jgi:hypothetical protein